MSDLIRKLKEQSKNSPELLLELERISGFPEQFQPYYLSVLCRTYKTGLNREILLSAGIRPATIADDIAHQVMSELHLLKKLK